MQNFFFFFYEIQKVLFKVQILITHIFCQKTLILKKIDREKFEKTKSWNHDEEIYLYVEIQVEQKHS